MQRNKTAKHNQVRIIGGTYRSRKLSFPDAEGLRPTGDRIRETLFNWLAPVITGTRCLDLFAGSGALGLEALSRGANQVVFVDSSVPACENIRRNLNALDLNLLSTGKAIVICADSINWLDKQGDQLKQGFDIIFLDPPFTASIHNLCSEKIAANNALQIGGYVYVERRKGDTFLPPNNWLCEKDKQTGNVSYQLFRRI